MESCNEKIVSVHQPVYFPWLGTLHKIAKSDTLVLYDDCLASRPSWMNRVYIVERGEKKWLTVPIFFSASQRQLARELQTNAITQWPIKHLKTIRQLYSRSTYWEDVQQLILPLHNLRRTQLAAINTVTMRHTLSLLGIRTPIVRSSKLDYDRATQACDKLAQIVTAAEGTAYLNGMGAGSYFNDTPFLDRNITVLQQRFTEPGYQPFNAPSFIPGLSVIDVVSNIGLNGVTNLLEKPFDIEAEGGGYYEQ